MHLRSYALQATPGAANPVHADALDRFVGSRLDRRVTALPRRRIAASCATLEKGASPDLQL